MKKFSISRNTAYFFHALLLLPHPQPLLLLLSLILNRGRGEGVTAPICSGSPRGVVDGCEAASWPSVRCCLDVSWTVEHKMFHRLVGAITMWTGGRVPVPDTVGDFTF